MQSKTKLRNKRWKVTIAYKRASGTTGTEVYAIKVPSKRYALAQGVYQLLQSRPYLLDDIGFHFTHLSTHANHIQDHPPQVVSK